MPKYIDADELIWAVDGNRFVTDSVKCYVRGTVRNIPAADVEPKRKWIPVTKSLPKQSGVYRVCGHRRGSPMASWECEFWIPATMNDGGWLNGAGRPCVEYWLPKSVLPELPKEEDDG